MFNCRCMFWWVLCLYLLLGAVCSSSTTCGTMTSGWTSEHRFIRQSACLAASSPSPDYWWVPVTSFAAPSPRGGAGGGGRCSNCALHCSPNFDRWSWSDGPDCGSSSDDNADIHSFTHWYIVESRSRLRAMQHDVITNKSYQDLNISMTKKVTNIFILVMIVQLHKHGH